MEIARNYLTAIVTRYTRQVAECVRFETYGVVRISCTCVCRGLALDLICTQSWLLINFGTGVPQLNLAGDVSTDLVSAGLPQSDAG